MSIDLHRQIIAFFEGIMSEHNAVVGCVRISDSDNFLYSVERVGDMPPVKVHLSDAYFYGLYDFLDRPEQITRGDFILIAKPEGSFGDDALKAAKEQGIGMGQIGKLMSVLHKAKIGEFETSQERQERLDRELKQRKYK